MDRSVAHVREGRSYGIVVLDEAGNTHTITGECTLEPDTFVVREDPLSVVGVGTSITARPPGFNISNDNEPLLVHGKLLDALKATKR
jgi:hypothetical protein